MTTDDIILTGDINIQIDKESSASATFVNIMESNGLLVQPDKPTHEKGHTLDIVATNLDTVVRVKDIGISDHYLLLFFPKISVQCPPKSFGNGETKSRNFRNVDNDKFVKDLYRTQ